MAFLSCLYSCAPAFGNCCTALYRVSWLSPEQLEEPCTAFQYVILACPQTHRKSAGQKKFLSCPEELHVVHLMSFVSGRRGKKMCLLLLSCSWTCLETKAKETRKRYRIGGRSYEVSQCQASAAKMRGNKNKAWKPCWRRAGRKRKM